jgi:hypothetical protein
VWLQHVGSTQLLQRHEWLLGTDAPLTPQSHGALSFLGTNLVPCTFWLFGGFFLSTGKLTLLLLSVLSLHLGEVGLGDHTHSRPREARRQPACDSGPL